MATAQELGSILWDASAQVEEIYCLNWIDLDSPPEELVDDLMESPRETLEAIFDIELPEDDYEDMEGAEDVLSYIVSDLGKLGFAAKILLDGFERVGNTDLLRVVGKRIEWIYCDSIVLLADAIESKVSSVREEMNSKLAPKA